MAASAPAPAPGLSPNHHHQNNGGQVWKTKQLREDFFSDPLQWWDDRSIKKNSNSPDFKNRSAAEKALWINKEVDPPWVHARIAVMAQGQEQRQFVSLPPETSGKVASVEQLWQEFFSDPSQWWDNRFVKTNPKYPDFKHKITQKGLWIEGWLNPLWVKDKVATMTLGQIQFGDGLQSWNVSKLCQEGRLKEALHMVELMGQQNIQAPISTYACLVKGCTRRKALAEGKRVHAVIVQRGLDSNIILGNTLVNMYAKCGSVNDARQAFNSMSEHNVFSWTTIISAYANHGQGKEAINLFQQMQQTGIPPNKVTFVVVLKACTRIPALEQGKQLHLDILKSGFESDGIVINALLDMYAKCTCIEYARRIFNNMHERNVVSWTTMIAGYAQNGLGKEALDLYEQMKQEGVQPDNVSYVVLLKACTSIVAPEEGKQLHTDIIESGFETDVIVVNTLVDMYAKCGLIEDARQVFNMMHERNVVSWTAMIAGYAQQGLGKEALTLLEQMQREGIKPNELTYVSALSACSHSGLVDKGRDLFNSMCKDHGVTPTMDHYACMVDLLGRAGCLADAEDFIRKMPIQPNAVVWMTLLGAARNHGHAEIGKRAFDCILKLEPENTAAYVLLSNIYAAAGRWDEVAKIRKEINNAGVEKMPGCSWIEVGNQVGYATYPQIEDIWTESDRLVAGYIPDLSFVQYNVEDE